MRKLFTFLFAALMSAGMFAATEVIITQNDFPQSGQSFTKDGVTVSAGMIDRGYGNIMRGGSFSTTLGNFTQIEVSANDVHRMSGEGWSGDSHSKTWTGYASSVSFSGEIMGNGQGVTLKFTIEAAAPTTYTLKLVADPVKGSVAVTNLLGSDIVDNGNGNYTVPENAKVTILATPNEGYEFSGWLEGNVLCDFIDCGTALNTLDNPLTFTMTNDAACKAEFAAAAPAAKYYIVGTMNSWQVDENYEMNPSLDAETEEYFYTLDLTTTSEFKVVKVQNGQQSWIPEGMGNNYGQNGEITADGEYTIYFRPNYDGGEGWFYSCIYAEKTGEFVPETPTYYLVGNMTEWDVNENYELNPNIDSDIEEYFYVLDLTTSSQFKVVKVQNGQQSWFPSGMGNNYGENGEITADGEYTVYFRPNYNGGEDWFYNCIYVSKNEPQVERELTKLGFNFPSENIPADNDIEMAGTFEEGTMWMEKIIATGWFVSYDFVNAAEDETFKLRSKSNNDLVLCQFIPANDGEGGKWVQAIFTFGNYWSDDTWKGTPCKLIEEDLSDAAQYAWMEGMPEPSPEPEPEPAGQVITWDSDDLNTFPEYLLQGESKTIKGITVTVNQGNLAAGNSQVGFNPNGSNDAFTFSTELGNFTKIECTTLMVTGSLGEGWESATWTGNANSVNFGNAGSFLVVSSITFTIEPSGGETAVDNIQIDKAQ
ncbi:MAG: hypothetical protein IJ882_02470, partial [Paludibacteraceae bacterium]|nr:hypothetical protein [Paludibacteraceae bacterium]